MADYEATVLGGALAFQLSAALLTSLLNFFVAHEPIPTGPAASLASSILLFYT